MWILLFLLSFLNPVFAWSPELLKTWEDTTLSHKFFINEPVFATFWGGLRRGLYLDHPKGEMIPIHPEGFSKKISVYIQANKEKRDLVIFYPGVFGRPDQGIAPQVIDELEKKNVHVVVIPNFLAAPYLIARPEGKGNPLEEEKRNQLLIFSEVIKQVKLQNINKIHVIGESLGCFQALNIVSSEYGKKTDKITLLWPPLDIGKAIIRFDSVITKSIPKYESCTYWWKWPLALMEVKMKSVPGGLDRNEKDCFGSWIIASVFVNSIKETSEQVTSASSLTPHKIPETFSQFIHLIIPEISTILSKRDKRFSLDTMIGKVKNKNLNIRVLSSIDDFLNDPDEWVSFKNHHPELETKIYLFSWGGHSGPMGLQGLVESLL